MQVITKQGDTVDLMCWAYYGRTDGVVEQVLEANPGLAGHGPVLPVGTLITLPDTADAPKQPPQVHLWD